MAAVLAVTASISSCGGNEGNSSASGAEGYDPEASTIVSVESISKAQFIKRINKECREAWVTVIDNWDQYTRTQDPKLSERQRFAEAVQLSFLSGIDFHIFDDVLALGAPVGEAETIEEIVGPFQIAVELGWKNRWRAYSVAEILPHFKGYNERAQRYGLDDCVLRQSRLTPIENLASS